MDAPPGPRGPRREGLPGLGHDALEVLDEHAECVPTLRPMRRIFIVPEGYDPVLDAPIPDDGMSVEVQLPAATIVGDPVANRLAQVLARYQDRSFHDVIGALAGPVDAADELWRLATALVEARVARFDPCARRAGGLHLTFDGDPEAVIQRVDVDYRTGEVLPRRGVWDQDPSYS